jgi:shikimate 5-dehydrogenase
LLEKDARHREKILTDFVGERVAVDGAGGDAGAILGAGMGGDAPRTIVHEERENRAAKTTKNTATNILVLLNMLKSF